MRAVSLLGAKMIQMVLLFGKDYIELCVLKIGWLCSRPQKLLLYSVLPRVINLLLCILLAFQ